MFTLSTYDNADHRINAEFVEVMSPHCVDSFNIHGASWNDTTNGVYYNPPSQLINDYYECYHKPIQSLLVSFGSAAGSANVLTALFVVLLVSFVTQSYKKKSRTEKRYTAKIIPVGNYNSANNFSSENDDDDGKLLKGSLVSNTNYSKAI